jgi:hypothetical protein
MHHRATWLVLAALLVAPGGAAAEAGIGQSPSGSMSTSGTVTFSASGLSIPCTLTIERIVPASVLKVDEAAVGSISSAALTNCRNATARLLPATLQPRYDSFEGTLPNITGIKLLMTGFAILIRIVTITNIGCLYRGSPLETFEPAAGSGTVSGTLTLATGLEAGVLCPPTIAVAGSFSSSTTFSLVLLD